MIKALRPRGFDPKVMLKIALFSITPLKFKEKYICNVIYMLFALLCEPVLSTDEALRDLLKSEWTSGRSREVIVVYE